MGSTETGIAEISSSAFQTVCKSSGCGACVDGRIISRPFEGDSDPSLLDLLNAVGLEISKLSFRLELRGKPALRLSASWSWFVCLADGNERIEYGPKSPLRGLLVCDRSLVRLARLRPRRRVGVDFPDSEPLSDLFRLLLRGGEDVSARGSGEELGLRWSSAYGDCFILLAKAENASCCSFWHDKTDTESQGLAL